MSEPLVVSEVFGPTVQGEGPSVGRRCGFVRLGRCNLACDWCDTPYTWDWSRHDPSVELSERVPADVLAELDAMQVDMVVVTGGEPLLQQRRLPSLLEPVRARGWRVEVETSGTIVPLAPTVALVDRFNVSPKLANSGMPASRRLRPDALAALRDTGCAVFKFVARDAGDLDEIAELVDELALRDVWVMPEGTDAATVLERTRTLAPHVIDRGWNLATRLHVLVWGDERGV